jgi:hypothetical protein
MSVIHLGDPFYVDLDTEVDLTAASSVSVLVKKPRSRKIYTLSASIDETVASALIDSEMNDEAGVWKFHAFAVFPGTGGTHGTVANQEVKNLWGPSP